MPSINYYQALGIKRDATLDEIKAARNRQSLTLHPDKNPYGVEIMKLVNAAYSVLSDVLKRRVYDRDLASSNYPYPDVSELERELVQVKKELVNSYYQKRKKSYLKHKLTVVMY